MKLQTTLVLALAATTTVFAQEETAAPADATTTNAFTAIEAVVNELGSTIGDKIGQLNNVKAKLNIIWEDPAYTSDAIEAKRKQIRDIQLSAIKAQAELRDMISDLPAVKTIVKEKDTLEDDIKKIRGEYKDAIDTLRKKRFEALNDPK